MLNPRKTQDLTQAYVGQMFGVTPATLRRTLEFNDEPSLLKEVNVTLDSLVDTFAGLSGLNKVRIFIMTGRSQPTSSRSKKNSAPASLDVVDRMFQATQLFARTVSMLGEEHARKWIAKPNAHLDGRAPVDLMSTATGRLRLERYLESLEDVTYG